MKLPMKLLLCIECDSIFNLSPLKEKTCDCGKTKGRYLDAINAEIEGPGIPLGFSNSNFPAALRSELTDLENKKEKQFGTDFSAFVIPWNARSIKHRGLEKLKEIWGKIKN